MAKPYPLYFKCLFNLEIKVRYAIMAVHLMTGWIYQEILR